MTPWRKRFLDYVQLLKQSDQTYFEPDLFRLNVNNALQTARTVTFIIQKNKSEIPNFDDWYRENVEQVLAADPIMRWFKDSRNHIEKQGDLELYSICSAQLLYSHTQEGPSISMKKTELLGAGVKKLQRFARRAFPTGAYLDSAIAIDRRWVANTLPLIELTDALQHGHGVLREIVRKLDDHTNHHDGELHEIAAIPVGSLTRRVYIKASDGKPFSMSHEKRIASRKLLEAAKDRYGDDVIAGAFRDNSTFADLFQKLSSSAVRLFNRDGYHVSIGFLIDHEMRPLEILQIHLADQAEKFIYWSQMAQITKLRQEIAGIIVISEFWTRSADRINSVRMDSLPIVGEGLQIVGLHKNGEFLIESYDVCDKVGKKQVVVSSHKSVARHLPNTLVPVAKAWALEELVKEAAKAEAETMNKFGV